MTMNIFKILVAGAYSSGKTTFIRTMSEIEVVSTEAHLPNQVWIAFDFGRVTANANTFLYFFGTPGARRFDLSWYTLLQQPPQLSGLILIVDAQRPQTFPEAQAILAEVRQAKAAYMLAANYRFPAEPRPSLLALREALHLRDDEMILPFYGTLLESSAITLEVLARLPADPAKDALIAKIEALNRT
jgi:hypothetical protein